MLVRQIRSSLLVLAVLAGVSACSSSGPFPQGSGPEPMLSVERFLQAANTGDLESMARIFGTVEGPILGRVGSPVGCAFRRMGSWVGVSRRCYSWQSVEVRLNTIALILAHDDYRLRSESALPGRRAPTRTVTVDLQRQGRTFEAVPFVVVRAGNGQWLVEEIGLDRVTGAR